MADRKVPITSKGTYGIGQMAEGFMNWTFGALVLFYYNQVLGVEGWLCGIAIGVALFFDAVTDPLAGSLSDNLKSRLGRRHPFMYAAAVPLAFAFYGLFAPPAGLGETGLFLWLTAFAILTRGAMTLYHVPHMALGAELTENFEERTSIVAYRAAFGVVGSLLAAALAFGYYLADGRGGRMNLEAYTPLSAVLAVGMVVTIWLSAYGTQKEIPYLVVQSKDTSGQGLIARLGREVTEAFSNRSFPWLFGGVLIVFLMVGVDGALFLYMNEFFWELTGGQTLLMFVIYPIGIICGSGLTRAIHARWDKKPGLVIGTAGWAALQIVPVVLRLAGAFPENHTTQLIWALGTFRFFQGMIVQQAIISFGSMMADVADEHELETGRRQEGIFFGAVSFSAKSASGLGNLIAGIGLTVISWPKGAEIQTAADIPAQTLVHLGLLFGPIVAGFAVVSVWCYSHYGLDRARHREILAELEVARKGTGASPSTPRTAAGALLVAVLALSALPAQAGIIEQVAYQGDDVRSLGVLDRFSDRALAEAFASIGIEDSSELQLGGPYFGNDRIFFPTERDPTGEPRCDAAAGSGCNDISDSDIVDFEPLGNALAVLHLEGPGDGLLVLANFERFDIGALPPVVVGSIFVGNRPIPEPSSALAFVVGTLLAAAAIRRRR